jgi:hypothetical protein
VFYIPTLHSSWTTWTANLHCQYYLYRNSLFSVAHHLIKFNHQQTQKSLSLLCLLYNTPLLEFKEERWTEVTGLLLLLLFSEVTVELHKHYCMYSSQRYYFILLDLHFGSHIDLNHSHGRAELINLKILSYNNAIIIKVLW